MMNSFTRIVSTYKSKNINLIRFSSTSYTVEYKWKMAVKNGEKVIGYPTSFMNLRWLLTDEISNIATYVSKLIGTKHPMVHVARDLLHQTDAAKWGLIVLLVSKAAGLKPRSVYTEVDEFTGLLHSQRSLAEITEMIKTGYQMHNTVMNLNQNDENYKNLQFGNKIALLSGDYLYSKSFKELALLNNNELNEVISTSLKDLSQAEFIQQRNEFGVPIPDKERHVYLKNSDLDPDNTMKHPVDPEKEWTLKSMLGGVNLLAKSCKGALILGGHSEEFQEIGFAFGRNIGLAWKCMEEVKPFLFDRSLPFSLTSAPVLFQLRDDPDMYELFERDNIPYGEIRKRVTNGEGVVEAIGLLEFLTAETLSILDRFPNNYSQFSLIQMVEALSVR